MTHADGVALVFPGQGSQRPGMARAWQDHPASDLWGRADDALGWDVSRLGLDASAEELRDPLACQVALYVHHGVLLEAWRKAGGEEPVVVAGHSLGEYSALLAAEVFTFEDGLRLVEARARATSEAARRNPGSLVACVGMRTPDVAAACEQVGAYLANDNAPGQIVVAGSPQALAELPAALEGAGGKVVPLQVGAAYHSPHMQPAVEPLREAVARAALSDARIPVVANVDARAYTSAAAWRRLLPEQLVSPVLWRDSVATIATLAGQVVELGASAVLTGMCKRIASDLTRRTVSTPQDLA